MRSVSYPRRLHHQGTQCGAGGSSRHRQTHLATAVGVQAVAHLHRRVRLFSTIELVNTLELEKAAGKGKYLSSSTQAIAVLGQHRRNMGAGYSCRSYVASVGSEGAVHPFCSGLFGRMRPRYHTAVDGDRYAAGTRCAS